MTDSILPQLPDWVAIGASFVWARERYHVRGFVDDHIICRRWMTTKQRWTYTALEHWMFEGGFLLSEIKRAPLQRITTDEDTAAEAHAEAKAGTEA